MNTYELVSQILQNQQQPVYYSKLQCMLNGLSIKDDCALWCEEKKQVDVGQTSRTHRFGDCAINPYSAEFLKIY